MQKLLNWNGKEIPQEMRELPAGRYVIADVDDVPELTEEEEMGLESAIASLNRGEGVDFETVKARVAGILKR